jgi:DNA-directed RNA polymerase
MVDSINATNRPKKVSEAQFLKQLELEDWLIGYGAEIATAKGWEKGGKGYMQKIYMPAMQRACLRIWKESQCRAQMFGADMSILKDDKAVMQVAGETLVYVLGIAEENVFRTKLINDVGKRAENTLLMLYLQRKLPGHMKSLRRLHGRDLDTKEMQARLSDRGFRASKSYRPMDNTQRQKLGLCFLEIARAVTKLFTWELIRVQKNKQKYQLRFTELYWQFMGNYKQCLEATRPHHAPLIIPPKPWTKSNTGGYYKIQSSLIGKMNTEEVKDALEIAQPCVLGSANYQQKQAFLFNHHVMNSQWAVWQQGHSIGKLPPRDRMKMPNNRDYAQTIEGGTKYWSDKYRWNSDQNLNPQRTKYLRNKLVYEKLKNETLYFAGEKDFRGRYYAKGGCVNYQLNEMYRSQLTFDTGAPLSRHWKEVVWAVGDAVGLRKCHQTREVWYRENMAQILRAGIDPLGAVAFWEGRKEPWRFMSLCREIFLAHQDPCHETKLIFWLDQTNSGYGHLAALTRDKKLALQTNVAGTEYNDLYADHQCRVKALVLEDLRTDPYNKHARWWLHNGKAEISRELMKLAVMPVVYARSHLTLMEVIREYIESIYVNFLVDDDEGGKLKSGVLANYLANKVHDAVKEIMPSIHSLDKWLRSYVDCFDDDELPGFSSANDMWVDVGKKQHFMNSSHLVLSGKRITFMAREERDEVDHKRSRQGLAPNYLHMLDASFLERFVHHWDVCYGQPIATVHDCFGTTLDSVGLMRDELCDQFNRFYSEDHSFKTAMTAIAKLKTRDKKRLPPFPFVDDLCLTEVGQNPFLFC